MNRSIKLIPILFGVLLLTGCQPAGIEVEVHNPSAAARNYETVEIPWERLTAGSEAITPDNVVVLDAARQQVSSQVVYEGSDDPKMLIFQVSVPGAGTQNYTIGKGKRQDYAVQAFGRFVPERADDYAWENNLAAYRVYGPALADPLTPGIDVWLKSTPRMVIDDWYAGKDYHTDKGEGMDAYKVGTTLGGGGSAPLIDEKLWLSGNYEKQERLDNGPIRTTVRLTYAPFPVGSTSAALEKTISLDANTHFSKMTNLYTGGFESIPVAAGFVLHEVRDTIVGPGYIGIVEAVSDSKQPETDGDVALGVLMPGAGEAVRVDGHLVLTAFARNGEPLVYWSGAGWSKAGVEDAAVWEAIILQKLEQINNPLIITIK